MDAFCRYRCCTSQDEPARNEKGQFVAKDEAVAEEEVAEVVAEDTAEPKQPEEQLEVGDIPKPTTWKKDLLPLWDKIAKGETLSKDESKKHLEYLNQRENEFKKGVSVYKAEAERAKALEEAINPFVPELQAQGIHPGVLPLPHDRRRRPGQDPRDDGRARPLPRRVPGDRPLVTPALCPRRAPPRRTLHAHAERHHRRP